MTLAKWEAVSATPEKRIYRNGDVELVATQLPSGVWELPMPGLPHVPCVDAVYVALEAYGSLLAESLQRSKPAPVKALRAEHRDRLWLRTEDAGSAFTPGLYRYNPDTNAWLVRKSGQTEWEYGGTEPGVFGGSTFAEYTPETVMALGDSHKDRKWKSSQADVFFSWGKHNHDDKHNWKWSTPTGTGEIDCCGPISEYNAEFGPFTEYWD
jgi:hypothetical protein